MYDIVCSDDAVKFFSSVPEKDRQHIKETLKLCLDKYLKTTTKRCNKKLLKGSEPKTYRLHVSMTYTFFYQIDEINSKVIIAKAFGINQAHSRYNQF